MLLKYLSFSLPIMIAGVIQAQPPGGPGGPGGSTAGSWVHSTPSGYPSYTYQVTANPGSYSWEGVRPASDGTGPFDENRSAGDGNLQYAATGHQVSASCQGNISESGFNSDSLILQAVSQGQFQEQWSYEGNPLTVQPTDFAGTMSVTWNLSCSGSAGFDLGWFDDPATSTSSASFGAGYAAAAPLSVVEDIGMSVSGWADNQLEDSSVSRVGVGLVSGPNKWKIWGVDIQFTPSTNQTGSAHAYSASSTATASELIPAVTINSAGTISYSWNVLASVDTNLNVYSNSAAGSASALATADMQIGPVPTAVDGTGTVTP